MTEHKDITPCDVVSTRLIPYPRERVFNAFRDAKQLQQWWGPAGFTNTFEVCEFRTDGVWRFVMHGPDGANYQNENAFREIVEPERIVIEHINAPHFVMTITLEAREHNAHCFITWHMRFDTPAIRDQLLDFITPKNQENFDRMMTVLEE